MGATISILYILMVSVFLYSKLLILINSSHTVITTNLIEGAIDQSDKFGYD